MILFNQFHNSDALHLLLETERLFLRVPLPEDACEMADFVTRNREHFSPWNPVRSEDYYTVNYWNTALAEIVENANRGTSLQLVLFPKTSEKPSIIGYCNFSNIVRGAFQAAYLGYGLDQYAVGKGLMAEALTCAIDYCFNTLNLHRIMANYMPANVRSASLLKRLGFVTEGFARDYLFLAGKWQDHLLTALTYDRWGSK